MSQSSALGNLQRGIPRLDMQIACSILEKHPAISQEFDRRIMTSQEEYKVRARTQDNIVNVGRHQRTVRCVIWRQNACSWWNCRLCDRHVEAVTPDGVFTCLFADASRRDV